MISLRFAEVGSVGELCIKQTSEAKEDLKSAAEHFLCD